MADPAATLTVLQTAAINSGLVNANQWNYVVRLAKHRQSLDDQRLEQATSVGIAEKQPAAAVVPPTQNEARYVAELMVEQGWVTAYQADQLLTGRSKLNLGPYIITDWIGQGGMGQVFKANHHYMDRECAVKVLPTSKTTNESLQGFMREIRMQARLDYPHLVRAYDAGQDGNVHYLVTEYVPGMDLRRLIKKNGPMSPNQAASIIMQAALGLQYAHEQGLIHRDVKPGNILVTPDGIAKVSDVGLAGFAADLTSDPRAGKVVGTADYLSPEQIRSPLEVTAASDVYSLGCTLYYAICGKVPFPGGDTQSKLKRHLTETPWHPRKFAPTLSEEFIDIIADMMEKDPVRRTQTCAEVAARLEAWAVEPSSVPSEQWTPGPWMAPPPPAVDLELDLPEFGSETSGASLDTSRQEMTQASSNRNPRASGEPKRASKLNLTQAPGLGTISDLSDNRKQTGSTTGLVILLTIAIAVPPTLLLGFVLGYLFK